MIKRGGRVRGISLSDSQMRENAAEEATGDKLLLDYSIAVRRRFAANACARRSSV